MKPDSKKVIDFFKDIGPLDSRCIHQTQHALPDISKMSLPTIIWKMYKKQGNLRVTRRDTCQHRTRMKHNYYSYVRVPESLEKTEPEQPKPSGDSEFRKYKNSYDSEIKDLKNKISQYNEMLRTLNDTIKRKDEKIEKLLGLINQL